MIKACFISRGGGKARGALVGSKYLPLPEFLFSRAKLR